MVKLVPFNSMFVSFCFVASISKASQAIGKSGSAHSGSERSQFKKLLTRLSITPLLVKPINGNNSLEFIFYTKFYFYWLI